MKITPICFLVSLLVSASNAAIVTIEHNITNLPASGYLSIDLDGDGLADINLASNFYVSSWGHTDFTRSYSLLGDVVDMNIAWTGGNDWPDPTGFVQDDHLYLAIRNTTIGDYYGYITYDYHPQTDSVSLNSYTYDDTGAAIIIAAAIPEPAPACLLGLGLVGLVGAARRRGWRASRGW